VNRFDELVGGVEDPAERERLRRVHDLLLQVEPPPTSVPQLRATPAAERGWPRRTVLALAATLALVAFGGGYAVGERQGGGELVRVIEMHGAQGEAEIELLAERRSSCSPRTAPGTGR
jgi:hypothetical protein